MPVVAMVLPFKPMALAEAFKLAKAAVLPSAAFRATEPPVPDAFKVRARAVLSLFTVLLVPLALMVRLREPLTSLSKVLAKATVALLAVAVKVVLAPKVTGPL